MLTIHYFGEYRQGARPSRTANWHRRSKKTFDGFGKFKEQFDSAAKDRLGSGWAWLSVTSEGDLAVSSTANQDSPLSNGCLPILGLDVWEHAYYLKYHNKRPDYITDWWHVVNWTKGPGTVREHNGLTVQ